MRYDYAWGAGPPVTETDAPDAQKPLAVRHQNREREPGAVDLPQVQLHRIARAPSEVQVTGVQRQRIRRLRPGGEAAGLRHAGVEPLHEGDRARRAGAAQGGGDPVLQRKRPGQIHRRIRGGSGSRVRDHGRRVRPVRGPTRLQQTDHSTSTGTRTGSSPNDRGSRAREGGRPTTTGRARRGRRGAGPGRAARVRRPPSSASRVCGCAAPPPAPRGRPLPDAHGRPLPGAGRCLQSVKSNSS